MKKNEKGFAFISVVTFTMLLTAAVLPYLHIMLAEKRMVLSSQNSSKVESIAEAALEEVFWEYNYSGGDFLSGEGWSGINTKTKTVNSFTDTSGNSLGNYTSSVAGWNTASPLVTVSAVSTTPGVGRQATMKTNMQPRPVYNGAVRTQGPVTMSGNAYVDSYNSSSGIYGGSNILQNGDVMTNSAAVNAIALTGNSLIHGDAATGPGGTVSDPLKVTGAVGSSANEAFPSNSVPSSLLLLPSFGSLNSTATLSTGNYKYTNLSLSGNNVVTVSGNVTLYLTNTSTAFSISGNGQVALTSGSTLAVYSEGSFQMSGNAAVNYNFGLTPAAVQLYGTSTCTSVQISGNGSFSGLMNVPQANTQISGNGVCYGAVVANQFTESGNGGVHYDEQLATNGPSSGFKMRWCRRV